ncbi:MAG: aldose 1-epimerase family protein [Jejuia sp.]
MYQLQNEKLIIGVKQTGAELCRIASSKNKTEFMWDANPDVWGSYAPNLFPIIGALKDNSYVFEGETYQLPKHGLIRNNSYVELHKQTENQLIFKLIANENTLKQYPFKFEFYVIYTLIDNSLKVTYEVKNKDHKTMYFSVGGHPAFKCPVFENESYSDYHLKFEKSETAERYMMDMVSGLMTSETKHVFEHADSLPLNGTLFNEDALVFKDLESRKITLNSKTHGEILSFQFDGFPYFGIWAKPNGNFVCLEPWLGIADHVNTNQQLIDKEGILKLEAGENFEIAYTIEIDDNHLI